MLLNVRDVFKSFYASGVAQARKVLDGVSLELKQGEAIAILGPSGSGKSTLLNIIGALDKPDQGEIHFDGRSLTTATEAELTHFRNREVGFVFQLHHLLPQCTVMENVLVPVVPVKDRAFKQSRRKIGEELLRHVGLWDHKDQKPGILSGGECQRVALIRALINQPKLILADEPTGSLDEENAASIISLLLDLNKEYDTSLIVVTHAPAIGARVGRQYELKHGKLRPKS